MARIPEYKLSTGAAIPSIGFGTWRIAEGIDAEEAVSEALKIGYRLIDTAKLYGNETSVGKAIKDSKIPREKIFVTTKLWNNDQGYQSALDAFEVSLERLGLDYIDLYLIHWPGMGARAYKESWRALNEIYERGDAKAVGVSNFSVDQLQDLMSDSQLVPAVNQIEFNPFNYDEQADTLGFCKEQAIIVQAYSPLARARQIDHPVIQDIASKIGRTNAQVMLRWAIQHGTVPIPKSVHSERMKENLDVFDFELSDEDINQLNSLSSHRFGFF
jgi:methylglyoxal/glyoxal reductase